MPPKPTTHQLDPLPAVYYYFFWLVEPTLTLIGAAICIFTPESYARGLLPARIEPLTAAMGATSRGQIIIGGLGSCFFLLAMISLSFIYFVKHHLPSPALQERCIKALLVPLAIGDITHIVLTLLPLPMSHLKTPAEWTVNMHGNVSITIFLLLTRTAYFLGIGRGLTNAITSSTAATKVRTAKREVKAALSSPGHASATSDGEATTTPAKRKPGRPRKSVTATTASAVDTPAPADTPASFKAYEVQTPATAKRGRGRPKKAAE